MAQDERFSKFNTDPKFRTVPKKERKVKIDDRFQSMFKDKRFLTKVAVDKRGRPENFTTKENYEKFYRLKDSDSDDDDDDDDEEDEEENDDKVHIKRPDKRLRDPAVDYARGEAVLTDSSSDEEDSSDNEEGEDQVEEEAQFDKWGELDHDAETTSDATKRLAVCNMDWDRVGAQDIFLALSSFCPPGGRVLKVTIYPSEFGKQRMAEEEALGPQELRGGEIHDDDSDPDELLPPTRDQEEKQKRDMEKVRKYQVNRLKYYYAVAEFNSDIAANRVYVQCDGSEYELSATRFDLRFVPDDMEFDVEEATETCDRAPEGDKYKPKMFATAALTSGKVDLTWDEVDPERLAAMKRAFETDDMDDNDDIQAYMAASSSDEDDQQVVKDESDVESDEEADVNKYKALLMDIKHEKEKATEGNMEVTFGPSDSVKAKEKEREEMTPWETYLHKKKEKRKEKRKKKNAEEWSDDDDDDDLPEDVDLNDPFFKQEGEKKSGKSNKKKRKRVQEDGDDKKDLSLLVMESDDDKDHFDYKQIVKTESKSKKKRKRKMGQVDAEDNFQLDVTDARFSAVFENAQFHVDPSNPNFKKTKSMQQFIDEKQKRILNKDYSSVQSGSVEKSTVVEPSAAGSSLDSLARKVKLKSKRMKGKKGKI